VAEKRQPFPKKILTSKPMDWRWVEYEYCQYMTQKVGIKSARQYRKWVRQYKPAGFPDKPERTYSSCWVSWNDFLGGDNTYLADHPMAVRKEDLMPYWEAVNMIQPLQFQTVEEYKEAFDAGQIPKGIPRYPHLRYTTFYNNGGYKNWLGKDIKHRVEASKNIEPLLVLYQSGQQPNVLSVLIHAKGLTNLMAELRENPKHVVKIFHWYPDFAEHVFAMLDHLGIKQDEQTWLFNNVNEVLFELSSVLEVFNP